MLYFPLCPAFKEDAIGAIMKTCVQTWPLILTVATTTCLLCAGSVAAASPNSFEVENLVSDIAGSANLDANLVNPWGLASGPTSPFWTANNGTGTSTLYNGDGVPQPQPGPLVVAIPPVASPTGATFNGGSDFQVASGNPARFLFSTENGAIAGWNPAVNQTTALNLFAATDGASYKGLTLGNSSGENFLYAPDFANGKIDVLNGSFQKVSLAGSFVDPNLPSGFVPFNAENIGGKLYVTYAKKENGEDVPGPGNGIVSVFDLNGNIEKRLISGDELNSPWGLAVAPADFGPFAGDLLVGNFGDGRINAYDLTTGDFIDTLRDANGIPVSIDGLWALRFGNGGAGGDLGDLYFTAGISGEKHGLFGEISAASTSPGTVPDGGTTASLLVSAAFLVFSAKRIGEGRRGKH